VVDLRHFLDPSGAIAELPAPVRRLAEYFASVVVDATANLDGEPAVHTRMASDCGAARQDCG
jgi:hypothetical protein